MYLMSARSYSSVVCQHTHTYAKTTLDSDRRTTPLRMKTRAQLHA